MRDEPESEQTTDEEAKDLSPVHERAMRRFTETVEPQIPVRMRALQARRFCDIPGAQWEGEWGEQWENTIKVEHNKVQRGVRKIETDYRQNRIVPDFRPAGGMANQDTADTLDGMHRADSHHFKAGQARDNAFSEAVRGGFGAYRLLNVLADPYDIQSDAQRINPGLIIVDADQRVFFDGNSKLYDKSDARFAFVLTALTRDAFVEEYGEERIADWSDGLPNRQHWFDWYTPDVIRVAEYYEVEETTADLLIMTHRVSNEERREWKEDMGAGELAELRAAGWKIATRKQQRRRVHKYTLSGAEVLEDNGFIAGKRIPIVPVYGQRTFVDNQETFKGHVQDKMDAQRLYNARVSRLAETSALAPYEKPIFAAEQMPQHLANLWAEQNINRHPYLLVEPLRNDDGTIASTSPLGYVKPPDMPPVEAALLQIANNDLTEEDVDGADEVKANVSAEAMDIAATRVDAKSGIYLDNMALSVACEAEIYLDMAGDVYFEPGRIVETMTEDGGDGEAVLQEPAKDAAGNFIIRNDFSRGRYKVVCSVTEATATRRDKAVRSMMNVAAVATEAGDTDMAKIALRTAVMNQDGEGTSAMQKWARRELVALGIEEPTDEEQAQLDQAAEEQEAQPDPAAEVLLAQAKDLIASAELKIAQADKARADETLSEAKTIETLAKAGEAGARIDAARMPANDISTPRIRRGYELEGAAA